MPTSELKIERGVPLPTDGRPGGRKYPFNSMQVGDSFAIPDTSARGGLYSIAKRDGVKITIRKNGDGLRVWRVA